MKAFNGYEPKRSYVREQLPAGGYVVKIMDVKPVHYDWGDILLLSFDVEEGEKKGFFREDYRGQTQEDKKWRGTYRLRIPADDGSERDGWTKNTFNSVMFAFEDSNNLRFDWDENKLKGLLVGALFRNEEWEMNGRTGWSTKCCSLIPTEDIRSGKFKTPKDKPLQDKPAVTAFAPTGRDFEALDDDDDLPF